mmetsp:Transcript_9929/g.21493  ORF Transcript_9929/g.21493 Transcript_9929/m.21493 type:complete len:230 (+) Transcript_9929:89-778(+)
MHESIRRGRARLRRDHCSRARVSTETKQRKRGFIDGEIKRANKKLNRAYPTLLLLLLHVTGQHETDRNCERSKPPPPRRRTPRRSTGATPPRTASDETPPPLPPSSPDFPRPPPRSTTGTTVAPSGRRTRTPPRRSRGACCDTIPSAPAPPPWPSRVSGRTPPGPSRTPRILPMHIFPDLLMHLSIRPSWCNPLDRRSPRRPRRKNLFGRRTTIRSGSRPLWRGWLPRR